MGGGRGAGGGGAVAEAKKEAADGPTKKKNKLKKDLNQMLSQARHSLDERREHNNW